jgi:hypothetical protein
MRVAEATIANVRCQSAILWVYVAAGATKHQRLARRWHGCTGQAVSCCVHLHNSSWKEGCMAQGVRQRVQEQQVLAMF